MAVVPHGVVAEDLPVVGEELLEMVKVALGGVCVARLVRGEAAKQVWVVGCL